MQTKKRPHLELGLHPALKRLIKKIIRLEQAEKIYENIQTKQNGLEKRKGFFSSTLQE